MKTFSFAILALFIACCSPRKDSPAAKSPLDSLIEVNMQEASIVGLSAAVLVDGRQAWAKAYGFADKESQKPYTLTTIQNIGSISKTFTGICMMHAVDAGKLSLDEDINKYLPFKVVNPYFPNEKITLRNLGGHVSGITDRDPIYDNSYYYGGDSPESLGDFLKNYFDPSGKYYSKDNFLNYKPGAHYKYSNIGAGLAGYITELALGKKLNQISKEVIFQPLKMDDSGWFLSEVNVSNHSKLYYYENDSLKHFELYGLTTYPDGGVRTSVNDLSKYFSCLLNGGEWEGARVIKAETLSEMMTPQFTAANKPDNIDPEKDNYGIFWGSDAGVIGHTGGDPGVATYMHYKPAEGVGIILFINTQLRGKPEWEKFEAINQTLWEHGKKLKGGSTDGR